MYVCERERERCERERCVRERYEREVCEGKMYGRCSRDVGTRARI